MQTHGKAYSTNEEFEQRYANFKATVQLVRTHQANPNRTFERAVNKFADLSSEEFAERYLGYRPVRREYLRSKNTVRLPTTALPSTVDWVAAGKVSAVKNQGQCGSCYTFSTTGAVEAAYAIEHSTSPPSLSEQEIVDCSGSYGNQGCNGGMMDNAFNWIINNGGICTESGYPYQAVQGNCQTSCTNYLTITSYTDVTPSSESQLQAALSRQPVSVAVDASQGWQTYAGGIIDSSCGCSTNLDHGVLLVAYGTDSGEAYWTIKNSWGPDWGENGYIRLKRNVGGAGTCGLASDPSYPTGTKRVSSRTRRSAGFFRV